KERPAVLDFWSADHGVREGNQQVHHQWGRVRNVVHGPERRGVLNRVQGGAVELGETRRLDDLYRLAQMPVGVHHETDARLALEQLQLEVTGEYARLIHALLDPPDITIVDARFAARFVTRTHPDHPGPADRRRRARRRPRDRTRRVGGT